jgi:hypothetical protein
VQHVRGVGSRHRQHHLQACAAAGAGEPCVLCGVWLCGVCCVLCAVFAASSPSAWGRVLSCGVYGSQDWSTNGPFQQYPLVVSAMTEPPSSPPLPIILAWPLPMPLPQPAAAAAASMCLCVCVLCFRHCCSVTFLNGLACDASSRPCSTRPRATATRTPRWGGRA